MVMENGSWVRLEGLCAFSACFFRSKIPILTSTDFVHIELKLYWNFSISIL